MTLLAPHSPTTGRPLRADGPHALTDGVERWPVVAGIPYLRTGRDDLRREALAALDAGDDRAALTLLLADQDPFAPLPPPSLEECRRLIGEVNAGRCGLRQAMSRLHFGPVADYFALRPSAPTFLSGLGLLSQCGGSLPVLELACGIGQLLREPSRRRIPVAGVDLVFSKLWLARRFVVADAQLICGDACGGPLAVPTTAAAVLCHDAFYFFADKPAAAAALLRMAGPGGRVLVGHAHNANWNHGVAGSLLTPQGYADQFPGCVMFDDAALTAAHLTGTPAESHHPAALDGVEAVSLAWHGRADLRPGPPDQYAVPVEGTELVMNSLLEAVQGLLRPKWPTARFAEEYRAADYLSDEPVPAADVLHAAASGLAGTAAAGGCVRAELLHEARRLARRRILLPREDVI